MTNSGLQPIVDSIERLEKEQKTLGADKRKAYVQAQSAGYNVKALRKLIRERKEDTADKAEIDAALNAYRVELGTVADAVSNGEMTIRQAEKTSGFSRSAIHREASHRKEHAFSGTLDGLSEGTRKTDTPNSGRAVPDEEQGQPPDDGLDLPDFLDRRARS